jgi:hypothetical protein
VQIERQRCFGTGEIFTATSYVDVPRTNAVIVPDAISRWITRPFRT